VNGIDFIGPSRRRADTEFDALRATLGAPPPWFADNALSAHLTQAMWPPATFFSAQDHVNSATGRPFSLAAYYADDADIIAYCDADGDRHLAMIGAPFVWRLVKVCDSLEGALAIRPRIGVTHEAAPRVAHDPGFAALLVGDDPVSEAEALDIVSGWPVADNDGQQIELGPYALFHDLIRLIWIHEWAHALTGHVRFAARDLQLMGLQEFSAERTAFRMPLSEHPPAHEVFQAMELHADEFATRFCTQQILWGYDPIGRMAGPRVDLVDRLLIYNVAFCLFAVMWSIAEERYSPEQSFYPPRDATPGPGPAPIFTSFTTTHPPAALRYMRFRDFQRQLVLPAREQYGENLMVLVDAVSYEFLSEALTDLDGHFHALLAETPMWVRTPTMKTLIAYESHLLPLSDFLKPFLVELGYRPTRDPMADDPA